MADGTDERSLTQRLPLPEGTLPVGLALIVAGVASYLFFLVGNGVVGDNFKPVSSMWFATFALAPGFFLPLEQEVGRALAHRTALGEGGLPVVRRVVFLGAMLATAVTIAILVLSPFLTDEFFEGSWLMTVTLVIAFVCYAPAHLARGICSGTGRFRSYAVVMGSDGLMRIVGCVVLAVIGITAAPAYGLVVATAPLIGIALVWRKGDLRTEPGRETSWAEVTPNLGWLLIGSVLAAGLVNAGPLATDLLAGSSIYEQQQVRQFSNAVLMARVPLFLFQAVQAALLPRLARLAAQGDLLEFRAGFRRLMGAVGAVGVFGTVAAFTAGPVVFDRLFNPEVDIDARRTLTVLALGSACYMIALATAQAVIALHGHAFVAVGWIVGMTVFVGVTALAGDDLFQRVEFGLLAGSAASMVTFALSLRARLSSDARADAGSILQAVTDLPLES